MRLVSLLPAATDWLVAFGAADRLVGVSHACSGPPSALVVTALQGPLPDEAGALDRAVRARLEADRPLVALDAEALKRLDPDLVVVQDGCRACAAHPADVGPTLQRLGIPTFGFDPVTFKQTLDAALDLAHRADVLPAAMRRIAAHENALRAWGHAHPAPEPHPRVAVLEWVDPLMLAGHWVPDLVEHAGGTPVGPASGDRSPTVPPEALQSLKPDVYVVMACGRTVAQSQQDLDRLRGPARDALSAAPVFVVDGSRYGSSPSPALYRAVELVGAALRGTPGAVPADELAAWAPAWA